MDNNFNNQPGQQYPNGQPYVQQNQGGMPNQPMQQQYIQQPMQFTAEPPKKNNKGLIAGIIGGVAVIAIIGIVALNNKGNGGIDDVSKLMPGNTTEYNTISTTTEVYETTEEYVDEDDTSAQEEVIRNIISAANKGDKAELEKYVSDDNPERTRESMIRSLETYFTPENLELVKPEIESIYRSGFDGDRELYKVKYYYEYFEEFVDNTLDSVDGEIPTRPYAVPSGRIAEYEFCLNETADGWVLWDEQWVSNTNGLIAKSVPDNNDEADTDEDIEAQKKVIEEFFEIIKDVDNIDEEKLSKMFSANNINNSTIEGKVKGTKSLFNIGEGCSNIELDRIVKGNSSADEYIYENVKSIDDIVNCRVYKADIYQKFKYENTEENKEEIAVFVLIKEGSEWKILETYLYQK